MVRNRVLEGKAGYYVLTPLVTLNRRAILINRGWVPNTDNASRRPDVPSPPSGVVSVVVRLRPSEPPAGNLAPATIMALGGAMVETVGLRPTFAAGAAILAAMALFALLTMSPRAAQEAQHPVLELVRNWLIDTRPASARRSSPTRTDSRSGA